MNGSPFPLLPPLLQQECADAQEDCLRRNLAAYATLRTSDVKPCRAPAPQHRPPAVNAPECRLSLLSPGVLGRQRAEEMQRQQRYAPENAFVARSQDPFFGVLPTPRAEVLLHLNPTLRSSNKPLCIPECKPVVRALRELPTSRGAQLQVARLFADRSIWRYLGIHGVTFYLPSSERLLFQQLKTQLRLDEQHKPVIIYDLDSALFAVGPLPYIQWVTSRTELFDWLGLSFEAPWLPQLHQWLSTTPAATLPESSRQQVHLVDIALSTAVITNDRAPFYVDENGVFRAVGEMNGE